ncbi:hypothetical protein NSP_43330 [Nodularia spumigena CCY9414]|nr:hypothetical protein NSP_43330 [Nodularia spumigena CCY9414]
MEDFSAFLLWLAAPSRVGDATILNFCTWVMYVSSKKMGLKPHPFMTA